MYDTPGFSPDSALPPQERVLRPLRARSGALALTVIVSILLLYLFQTVGVWAVSAFLGAIGYSGPAALLNELYTGLLVYPAAFGLPYLAYARLTGFPLRAVPHNRPHADILAASIGIALGLSVPGAVLSMAVTAFFAGFGMAPPTVPMDLPSGPAASAFSILNMTLIPAFIEELTFRGIVLGSLRPYGDRFAIAVSALLFALLHRNMAQIPNALLLGLALGYFLVKTDSIFTSMAIHFANNLLVLLFSMMTMPLGIAGYLLAELLLYFVYLLLGLLGVSYLAAARGLDLRLYPSECPVRGPALLRRFFLNFPMLLLLALFAWVIYLSFL